MVAVNSLLYFLLSAGLSSNPDQSQDVQSYDSLNGMDLAKLCPPREHLSDCEAHCQKNCTNFNKPFACPLVCVKGCVCDEGLVRSANGKCIEPKQCPGKDTCPRGEHYDQCSAHCQRNCTTWGQPILCPRLCVHGCVCNLGTVRGPKGKCIKPDKCPRESFSELESEEDEVSPSFCPPNEEYSHCLAHCQRNCSNWAEENIRCKKICVPGCVCVEGMVRGPKGQCMWPRQCPPKVEEVSAESPFTCPENERFTRCDAYCQKNCSNHDEDIPCRKICVWGCICDEGFTRGPDGRCIEIEDCPEPESQSVSEAEVVCPRKEHFSECEAHCQKNCTNHNKPFPCPRMCVKGCVCDEGLVRGQDGKCITPKQCPGQNVCPNGEHYDQCNAHCQRNCTTWDKPLPCVLMCVHGCVCDLGTVRGPKGKCIKPDTCPKTSFSEQDSEEQGVVVTEDEIECSANEHLSMCGAHCQKNCTNYNKPIPCPYICVKGCVCDEGFVRGRDGKCVKTEECPAKDVCPRGEHYDQCGAHCQRNCTTWGKPLPCPFICVHGCVCNKGTVRGPNGRCIRPNRCPKKSSSEEIEEEVFSHAAKKCPSKEHMSDCDGNCQKNCNNYKKPPPCPKKCVKGCVCDKGLVRDADGKCVATKKCPDEEKKCPPKEHMSDCDANCQKNCINHNKPLPCPKKCVKGCVCDKGLVRAADGKCVAPNQCPDEEKKCPPKEHFSDCEAHCQKNCTNFNKPFPCPLKCVKGCVCDKGLVRAADGKCVAPKQCPGKDVCPRGEHYDQCNAHCQRNCTTWGKPLPCPLKCVHGCVCDLGTTRGPKGKCIKPDTCPKKSFSEQDSEEQDVFEADFCLENEEYSRCKANCQGNCRYKEKSCAGVCVPGCRCKEGYVRGPKGNCILPRECTSKEIPRELMCPTNEHFDRCTAHCQKNCTTKDEIIPCPRICVGGCICDRGFIRGLDGKCILRDQCPPPNEISTSSEEIASSQEDSTRIYEYISSQEEEEIRSQDEFAATDFCPANAEYSHCEAHCEGNCEYKTIHCSKLCVSGCRCKKGFVRGPEGDCIPPKDCPSKEYPEEFVCPSNERYTPCAAPCQSNCTNIHRPLPCPLICIKGCICEKGLLRGIDGKCIPRDHCPADSLSSEISSQEDSTRIYYELTRSQEEEDSRISDEIRNVEECPVNEHYDRCNYQCQRNCSNWEKETFPCPMICSPGCVCDHGFVRGPHGSCIKPEKCSEESHSPLDQIPIPIFCKKNEVVVPCPCPVDCDNYETKKCYICIPGCQCKSGYVKGPDGICIKKEECPREKKPEDCTELEFYDSCGSACPDDCTNFNQQDRECTKNCAVGCFCIPGSVRGPNGDCIFPFECPAKAPLHP